MSRKNVHQTDRGNRDRKREQFQGTGAPPRSSRAWLVVAGVGVLVGAVVSLGLLSGGAGGTATGSGDAVSPATPATPVAASAQGQVRLALADLAGGTAQFYEYPAANGRSIRFFALRGHDGTYRAALDACEICYHAKKGYYQNGGEMVCRQCGNSYAPALIDEAPGGCHPMALPRAVDGEHLVVLAADIERVDAQLASQPPPAARGPMRRAAQPAAARGGN